MKKVLFVCYGGGHVAMVLPVARALARQGRVQVQVLGLTTAAPVVRQAGLQLLQFKDFLRDGDAAALDTGRRLAAGLGTVADPGETAAYLGLCYAELEAEHGVEEAARRYADLGRQAFLPRRTLRRILETVRPDLVVATNSPRAERAAVEVARSLGIPCVCMVDLFAIDEMRWIGRAGYADRVCVLNESVRQSMLQAGRDAREVVVTGNPAFDALRSAETQAAGARLRHRSGWDGRRVVLWAAQDEPAVHPFNGRPGDPTLPARVWESLTHWVRGRPDALLCFRPRPGQAAPELIDSPQLVLTGQDWHLAALLHAVDVVVTLTSTVGLEGHLAGTRLVQVAGSVFQDAMPLAEYGIADEAVALPELSAALDRVLRLGRRAVGGSGPAATPAVLAVLGEFL